MIQIGGGKQVDHAMNWIILIIVKSSHIQNQPCARHIHFTHFFVPHFSSPSSANSTDSVGSHLSLGNNQQSGIAVDAEDVAQKLRLEQVKRGAEWLWRFGAPSFARNFTLSQPPQTSSVNNRHSHSPRLPSCQSHNRSCSINDLPTFHCFMTTTKAWQVASVQSTFPSFISPAMLPSASHARDILLWFI